MPYGCSYQFKGDQASHFNLRDGTASDTTYRLLCLAAGPPVVPGGTYAKFSLGKTLGHLHGTCRTGRKESDPVNGFQQLPGEWKLEEQGITQGWENL